MQRMGRIVKSRNKADARKERWIAHRERRRQEFVEAALRVLEEQGPDLPMDAVAAEAGVTKPVLYRYFSDKSALVEALAEVGSQILTERLLPTISVGRPARESVRDSVSAYFALLDEYPNLYWLLARHACLGANGVIQRNRDAIARALTAVFGDYMRAFHLDSGPAEPWAYGLTGLVQSTGEWWLQRRTMSRATVVEYVTDLIWAAISGLLSDAAVAVDPDQPLPTVRPTLTLHIGDGQDAHAGTE